MAYKYLIFFIFLCFLQLVNGCNEPRDPSSYGNKSARIQVTIDLDAKLSRQQNQYNILAEDFSLVGLPAATQTALIIAVPSGTTFNENHNLVTSFEDKALIDLSTSLVTLNLPVNQSLYLYEYTFNALHSTVASLNGLKAYSAAKMGPITINSSTTQVTVTAKLYQTMAGGFFDIIASGSSSIQVDNNAGVAAYSYSDLIWAPAPLSETFFKYDPTTDVWTEYTPSNDYWEFFDNTHDTGDGVINQITDGTVDTDNLKILYTDNIAPYYPDFTIYLTDVIDLHDQQGVFPLESHGDMKDKNLNVPLQKGALAYEFEVTGFPKYSLEEVATAHDCSGDTEISTPFNSFTEFLTYYSDASNDFTCREGDHYTCLQFRNYTPGDTTGIVTEVHRNQSDYSIDSSVDVGTWVIDSTTDAEQPEPMLFFNPNSSDYYYEGQWTEMWAEFNGDGSTKLWRGYYSVNPNPSHKMLHFNQIALNNFKDYLDTLSPGDNAFVAENNDNGCYQPFELYGTSPANGDTGVSQSEPIMIQFSKALNTGAFLLASASCSGGDIAVTNDSGFSACYSDASPDISFAFEDGNRRVRIDPTTNWPSSDTIYVRIYSTIKSYVNEDLNTTIDFSFTTGP